MKSPFPVPPSSNGKCNASQKFVALTIHMHGPLLERVRNEPLLAVKVANLVAVRHMLTIEPISDLRNRFDIVVVFRVARFSVSVRLVMRVSPGMSYCESDDRDGGGDGLGAEPKRPSGRIDFWIREGCHSS